MSNTDRFSLKFLVLALVVNTANLINTRATRTLSISHAVLAPITFITTYVFLGILVIGAYRQRYASDFLQIYSLVSCCSLHTALSILVFNDLKNTDNLGTDGDVERILNAVLPMFTIVLLVADLTVILFSNRNDMTIPSARSSRTDSRSRPPSVTVVPKQNGDGARPDLPKLGIEARSLRIVEDETPTAATSRAPEARTLRIDEEKTQAAPTSEAPEASTLRIEEAQAAATLTEPEMRQSKNSNKQ